MGDGAVQHGSVLLVRVFLVCKALLVIEGVVLPVPVNLAYWLKILPGVGPGMRKRSRTASPWHLQNG